MTQYQVANQRSPQLWRHALLPIRGALNYDVTSYCQSEELQKVWRQTRQPIRGSAFEKKKKMRPLIPQWKKYVITFLLFIHFHKGFKTEFFFIVFSFSLSFKEKHKNTKRRTRKWKRAKTGLEVNNSNHFDQHYSKAKSLVHSDYLKRNCTIECHNYSSANILFFFHFFPSFYTHSSANVLFFPFLSLFLHSFIYFYFLSQRILLSELGSTAKNHKLATGYSSLCNSFALNFKCKLRVL